MKSTAFVGRTAQTFIARMKKNNGYLPLLLLTLILILNSSSVASAQSNKFAETENPPGWHTPNWSEKATISSQSRKNIYDFEPLQQEQSVHSGKLVSLVYPVEISSMMLPYKLTEQFFSGTSTNPLQWFVQNIFKNFSNIKSLDDVYQWLGLSTYPTIEQNKLFPKELQIPYPNGTRPQFRMGTSLVATPHALGLTFGCATCHANTLFGRPILGLTARFQRANEFFMLGQQAVTLIPPELFKLSTGATEGELELFLRTRNGVQWIGNKKPQALGLDTSLAQVSLSLARRAPDAWASLTNESKKHPRPNALDNDIADSKPSVWWNLKYKNRWLSDGSVVSGNPIYTNILWNEIGRGTDLHALNKWLTQNKQTIADLTSAAFATEAPHYTDFFPPENINLDSAMRGEKLFNERCAFCHGSYEKAWHSVDKNFLDSKSLLKTTHVNYHSQTPVIDVGTDPWRYRGMKAFADGLNTLQISKENMVVVKPQVGYVPPPLVGIWARWPYFHNNSAPSLCAVLKRQSERPITYQAGEAVSPQTDFDQKCNGYPLGNNVPKNWFNKKEAFFDTRRSGMSNSGHDEGIFLQNGSEIFSSDDKWDIVEFLKTL